MQALVSVVVLTYNSAKFIIETLESVKAQTYKNIELIVTDDGSADNTNQTVADWLIENKSRFESVNHLTVEKNTGISTNINRGIKAGKGEFVKVFGGDDILLPKCIEINMRHITNSDVVISQLQKQIGDTIFDDTKAHSDRVKLLLSRTPKKRHKSYLRFPFFLNPPAWFVRRSIYDVTGYCDESIPYLDDQPMYCKVLKSNLRVVFAEEPTIIYRISQTGITNGGFKLHFKYSIIDAYKKYRRPYLNWYNPLDLLIITEMSLYIWVVGKYKRSTFLYALLRQTRFSERIITLLKL